nr:MAG TPA: hypothetical protein [Caudoviricetes sp.]
MTSSISFLSISTFSPFGVILRPPPNLYLTNILVWDLFPLLTIIERKFYLSNMCYRQIVAAYFLYAKRLLRWKRTDYWTILMIWYTNP